MSSEELKEKLQELRNEDIIWLIYIGIIFMSWYSNTFERKYFIYGDEQSKEKYRQLTIIIFIILVISYTYFTKSSYTALKNLKPYDDLKAKKLTYLSFIGSVLILISGLMFLYIAIQNENIDVEIAFN